MAAPVTVSNPVQALFHDEFGIDSFALDGDASPVEDSWADVARRR